MPERGPAGGLAAPARGALLALGVVATLGACGGRQHTHAAAGGDSNFECLQRSSEYMVVGGFAAAEAGVSMLCDEGRPRIVKWTADESGHRTKVTHALTGAEFDEVWGKIDATGWRFLGKKCPNPGAGKKDPIYTIDVGDAKTRVDLTCVGKELPFPYDRLVNELDLRAAGFGDDAGAPL